MIETTRLEGHWTIKVLACAKDFLLTMLTSYYPSPDTGNLVFYLEKNRSVNENPR